MTSTKPSKSQVLSLIESEAPKHIALLQSLIRTPSPNPPGDTVAAIQVVREHLTSLGIPTNIIAPKPESPNLISTIHGTKEGKTLILNGHIDQFPVSDASQWQRNPYSGDVENGFIHGRSGVDMKAGTAAAIIAFTYLHKFKANINGRCILQIVSDEETGGRWGTRYLLEDDADKGKLKEGDVAVLIGEPSGLNSIRFGEKGTLRFTLTVTAQGAHGAYTHRSEGAIRIAARLIERLVGLEKVDLGMDAEIREHMQSPEVRKVAEEIMWPGAADAMLYPSVNIGTIRGGAKINMIPSECVVEVDIRIPIGVETSAVRKYIDGVLVDFPTASYVIHENHSHVSTHTDPTHQLVEILQGNAETVRGEKPVAICSLGATDCKHFRRNDISAFAYGPHPKGMAERDEKVSVKDFLDTVKVHTLTAWEYFGNRE